VLGRVAIVDGRMPARRRWTSLPRRGLPHKSWPAASWPPGRTTRPSAEATRTPSRRALEMNGAATSSRCRRIASRRPITSPACSSMVRVASRWSTRAPQAPTTSWPRSARERVVARQGRPPLSGAPPQPGVVRQLLSSAGQMSARSTMSNRRRAAGQEGPSGRGTGPRRTWVPAPGSGGRSTDEAESLVEL